MNFHVRLLATSSLALGCWVCAAAGATFHTKSIDNFMCADPKASAMLLDEHLGRQKIPEPDLRAIYSSGDCLGTDPAVSFNLVSVSVVRIFDRPYRIAKVRFIPSAAGETAFTNYIPVDQIEQTP